MKQPPQPQETASYYYRLAHEGNNQPWEVAVACDIHLGEVIANDPLQTSEVKVNPEAVHSILTRFNAAGGGKVLFIASTEETVTAQVQGSLSEDVDHPVGIANNGETIVIHSAVSGEHIGVGPLNFNYHADAHRSMSSRLAKYALFTDSKTVQEIAVHELRHAADFRDPSLWTEPQAEEDRIARRLGIVLSGIFASFPISVSMFNRVCDRRLTVAIGLGALVTSTTYMIGNTYRKKLFKSFSDNLSYLLESRAEEAERNIDSTPTVITLH